MKRIGIDIGSTTIKIVVIDHQGKLIFSEYQRHFSCIREKLCELLNKLESRLTDKEYLICFSGSAGMGISEVLDLDFIQEVYATSMAVSIRHPETDVVIELGGEDAKILFLKGNREVRMNGSCAGGTGAFIDQMAALLGIEVAELNHLALMHQRIYDIASRCGVFAKSDIQPLLNQGATKEDIAASILKAVVDQTVIGLAQGRKICGNVLYLGGPLTYMDALRKQFDSHLGLQGYCPDHALFFVAMGAAGEAKQVVSLEKLIAKLKEERKETHFKYETPLFEDESTYSAFVKRHKEKGSKISKTAYHEGSFYLGIDAGSTTLKAVVIDEEKKILASTYEVNNGNVVMHMKHFLEELFNKYPNLKIKASAVTGYGEELIKEAFEFDYGLVETLAHFEGAKFFMPEVDFVIDIGGQDMKCFKIEGGRITHIFLNEACSSGCGSFLQNFATSLGYSVEAFARLGLFAKKPVSLGSRCTVFMNSSVKQAQKEGASIADLSAGLAMSVVKNALYKVLRMTAGSDIGKHIVVQGGTFLNDGILRSFEREIGCEVIRPEASELMGAFGAALYAAHQHSKEQVAIEETTPLTKERIAAFKQEVTTTKCQGCVNKCTLTINHFPDGRSFIGGNRCDRPLKTKGLQGDNLYAYRRAYLDALCKSENGGEGRAIGIPMVLNMYEFLPFWHKLFCLLGFKVIVSPQSDKGLYHKGQITIPSDTVCYPAKLVHGHIAALVEAGVDAIFYPNMPYNFAEGGKGKLFNCPVAGFYPEVIKASRDWGELSSPVLINESILLNNPRKATKDIVSVLKKYFHFFAEKQIRKAVKEAYKAYEVYKEDVFNEAMKYLRRAEQTGGKIVVLAGRPYHIDPEIGHGIDTLLSHSGITVLSEDALSYGRKPVKLKVLDQWTYQSRLYKAADFVRHYKGKGRIYFVQLISFSCGTDAITSDELRDLLEEEGKQYTQIKIDEINNLGAVKIRLRSLLEAADEGGEV